MIEGYYVVELMGHVRHIGMTREVEMFGSKLGACDDMQSDGSIVTVYFGAGSVYRITPTTEEAAKQMRVPRAVRALSPRPVCPDCQDSWPDCICSEDDTDEFEEDL